MINSDIELKKIINLIKFMGEYVEDPIWTPNFFKVMTMWYSERKRHIYSCNFCGDDADYEINVGKWRNPYQSPHDYYYHTVCRNHLLIKKCERQKLVDIAFKCDFCDEVAKYYIMCGGHGKQIYDNADGYNVDFPRKHFVCENHIRLIKYDNRLASEWYSTYMKI